jgi:lambda repressor-like predicted transcriptional regulator
MKMLKKFENYMSREEMCSMLASNGYSMNELEVCSDAELEMMVQNMSNSNNMNSNSAVSESYMSREEICNALCNNGYSMRDLEVCTNAELEMMYADMKSNNNSNMNSNSAVSESYMSREEICAALSNNGYSMRDLEVCTNAELEMMYADMMSNNNSNMNSNSAVSEKKKYNKRLKSFREHNETQNYMFFSNLETIKRLVDEMLKMDESSLDAMLSEHDWASDHISVAAENIEHVFNFVASHDEPEHGYDSHDGSFGGDSEDNYGYASHSGDFGGDDSEYSEVEDQKENFKSLRKLKPFNAYGINEEEGVIRKFFTGHESAEAKANAEKEFTKALDEAEALVKKNPSKYKFNREALEKKAKENSYRGGLRIQQGGRDPRIFVVYDEGTTGLEQMASGASGEVNIRR